MHFKPLTASFFYLTLAVGSLSAVAGAAPPPILETALPSDRDAIDKEIKLLEEELQSYRSAAFKKELEAQAYMFDNWHDFAKEIGQHETDEKYISAIKERLAQLYTRKAVLDSPTHPQ